MTEKELTQNTNEWLRFRRQRIGASDVPIILGKSPWSTPRKLWLEKTGQVIPERTTNFAIERGIKFEGPARSGYELETGLNLPPTILVDATYPFLMCSLDGYSKDESIVWECKVAGHEVFSLAKKGKVHEKYYGQVMLQLYISKAKEAHFYCVKVENINGIEMIVDTALVVVKPDEEYIKDMLVQLLAFWDMVQKRIPPPLCDRDVIELDDQSSVFLFSRVKQIKEEMKAAEMLLEKATEGLSVLKDKYEEIRPEMIEHLEAQGHTRFRCLDVLVYKDKRGNWNVRVDKKEDESSAETLSLKQG